MAAHQAPPSLGFSRQEHWSGLPFPSPMHESEKWKGSRSVVSDSKRPHGLQPTRLLCPWDFPGKSTGVGCRCLLRVWFPSIVKSTHFYFVYSVHIFGASQVALVVKNLPANAGDIRDEGSIPGSGRSPGGGLDNPLQYSWLEDPWTEELRGLPYLWSHWVRHYWSDLACMHSHIHIFEFSQNFWVYFSKHQFKSSSTPAVWAKERKGFCRADLETKLGSHLLVCSLRACLLWQTLAGRLWLVLLKFRLLNLETSIGIDTELHFVCLHRILMHESQLSLMASLYNYFSTWHM